ncbi:MAG: hypothetical protein JXA82_19955 [Sedimentisphaerales bacterium]|nr:hypothetical protein [Sedimentisphaerales bacterium]
MNRMLDVTLRAVGVVLFLAVSVGLIVQIFRVRDPERVESQSHSNEPMQTRVHVPLDAVADAFDAFQVEHNGQFPVCLGEIFGQYTIEPEYVYRGEDLHASGPAGMILVYEKQPGSDGTRKVLFVGKVKGYFVDDRPVTRAEFERVWKEMVNTYDPEKRMITDDSIMILDPQTRLWRSRIYTEPARIRILASDEFEQAIKRDNQLRRENNLPQKPIL